MTPDQYLQTILQRETVDTGIFSPVRAVQNKLQPIIQGWAGNNLVSVAPSGSFAKGTANHSGTDIDLFISLSANTPNNLKEIYDTLFASMRRYGYNPKRQNVSINVRVNGYSVDLVPGKLQNIFSCDHSLYRCKAGTWTKTNVTMHISHVTVNGRQNESRIIKLWRDQKRLDFPSFYLELSVINALYGQYQGLSGNVMKVFEYLRDIFPTSRVIDPANSNNIISDDLSVADREKVKAAAERALSASNWNQIVI